jgi:DHA1 family tetracycline resistance protein-like MFS transporter
MAHSDMTKTEIEQAPPVPEPAKPRGSGKNAFLFVIVTVFIDILAFAIVIPSFPFLMVELTDMTMEQVVPWGGYIATVYALVNFVAQPVLGSLSDRYGRRPVLLASMGTLALEFIIMGFAHSIWLLFLGRFLSGLSSATHSTAAAYIADTTRPEDRAAAFGMIGAAFGVGFIFGPVIGGLLSALDPRAPFFAAAGLAALNCLYGLLVLPESLPAQRRRSFDIRRANAFGAFRHFSRLPHLYWFMLAAGLFNFGHWVYPGTFSYYGPIRYGWDASMTGLALGAVGIGAAIVQGGLVSPIIKRFGPARTVLFGSVAQIIAFLGYVMASEGWMVFLIIPIGSLGGVMGPALQQITSSRVGPSEQGELQGALASIQALGNVFAPVIMTQTLFTFSQPGAVIHLPGAAFLLAALVTLGGTLLLIRGLRTPFTAERG